MSNKINIRAVTANDAKTIVDIYNFYIENTVITLAEELMSVDDMENFIATVQNDSLPWLVAQQNNEIIGYAYATKWRKRSAFCKTVEVSVYLQQDIKRAGIGSVLYKALFAELQKIKIHNALACITIPYDASVKFHEKLGFVKIGHFTEVGYKFNKWQDVGFWQIKIL